MKIIAPLLALSALLVPIFVKADPPAAAQKPIPEKEFKALTYKSMPYRLLVPDNYDRSKRYPLVLYLHGYGERGTDNAKQLKHHVGRFIQPDVRRKHPCFVLAPQAPSAWINVRTPCDKPIPAPKKIPPSIALALEILKSVENEYSVDKRRIYLAGASNGACAVWCLLERDPKRWAAAAPLAGAGDPRSIADARLVPIWAFHGDKDSVILVDRSREMIAALKGAGGTPKYTEYPGLDHGAGIAKASSERELLPWLFKQQKK